MRHRAKRKRKPVALGSRENERGIKVERAASCQGFISDPADGLKGSALTARLYLFILRAVISYRGGMSQSRWSVSVRGVGGNIPAQLPSPGAVIIP